MLRTAPGVWGRFQWSETCCSGRRSLVQVHRAQAVGQWLFQMPGAAAAGTGGGIGSARPASRGTEPRPVFVLAP